MKKLTGIVIAKDDEEMIADCLDSLLFCDEILVIDGGSSDRTMEIAKRIDKVKVFSYKTSNFSALRNFGLEKAAGDWIFYIDTDERVSEELKENIKLRLSSDIDISAYKIKRRNFYLGNFESPSTEKLERLFNKYKIDKWIGELHESPVIKGKIGELDGFINHYTHRNLNSMLKKTIDWSDVEAKLRFNASHPKMSWWRFLRVMLTSFFDSYFFKKTYKMGTAGLIESIYQSFSTFITYGKLWELQIKDDKGKIKTNN